MAVSPMRWHVLHLYAQCCRRLRPMERNTSSPLSYCYQNFIPDTWIICHAFWYQKLWQNRTCFWYEILVQYYTPGWLRCTSLHLLQCSIRSPNMVQRERYTLINTWHSARHRACQDKWTTHPRQRGRHCRPDLGPDWRLHSVLPQNSHHPRTECHSVQSRQLSANHTTQLNDDD